MKSLEDVIRAYEKCQDDNCNCVGCTYADEQGNSNCKELGNDTLYYLRQYENIIYSGETFYRAFRSLNMQFKEAIERMKGENNADVL